MAKARQAQFPQHQVCYVHAISKCVRGAWLCGVDEEGHDWSCRKVWLRNCLQRVSECYAIEVDTYAIMSNHFHLLVKINPAQTENWSDQEVLQRWYKAHPAAVYRLMHQLGLKEPQARELVVQNKLADTDNTQKLRKRLSNLGWFMKAIKEPFAKKCNQQEGKEGAGAFWQGRYKSIWTKDDAAIMACRVYIDSNPLRAAVVDSVEKQQDTSLTERLAAHKQATEAFLTMLEDRRQNGPDLFAPVAQEFEHEHSDETGWLLKLRSGDATLNLFEYISLLEQTSRQVRKGKAHKAGGSLSDPALTQTVQKMLDMPVEAWLKQVMRSGGNRRRRQAA